MVDGNREYEVIAEGTVSGFKDEEGKHSVKFHGTCNYTAKNGEEEYNVDENREYEIVTEGTIAAIKTNADISIP